MSTKNLRYLLTSLILVFAIPELVTAQTLDDDDLRTSAAKESFKVETVAVGLVVPWSIAFPAADTILVTERPGRVRIIEDGTLLSEPALTLSNLYTKGENGLMGMVLHPQHRSNSFVYLAYVYKQRDDKFVRVSRYRFDERRLVEPKTIIEKIPAAKYHAGTRLAFGPDGKLYITTGDARKQKNAQRLKSISGKTLRLNDDGTIPTDNPFYDTPGARREIWSYGHRNAQGIAWQPGSGRMFQTEHGPSFIDGVSLFKKRTGGDEINLVEKGKNYGWAKISHKMKKVGMESPLVEYSPAVAPGSAMFYTGGLFPAFKGNFFFGALKGKALYRVEFEGAKPVAQEVLLEKQFGRIRDIAQGPEGAIYFTTSNRDGRGEPADEDDRLLKLVPVE
ncbi:MAG: PQQ-dependent sugar dehydrogenase [Pyrinomonadaceae bacterium]|nr:PQQ-dependent sugar dehydrogenase [Pyrinomonadaceae bacterium]